MVTSLGSGILALPSIDGHAEMSGGGLAINAGTDTPPALRVCRGITWLLALILLPVVASERVRAEESAETALPQLPAKIRAQLEAERLRREIALEELRRELEALQGTEDSDVGRRIERLGALRRLLEVDRDVRELLEDSPDMAAEYERLVSASAPSADVTPQGPCACLANARVHWLGEGDQAGQVIVYLDGLYHDVQAGEEIGDSRCRVQQATVDGVTLACGAATSTRSLHNPVDGSR